MFKKNDKPITEGEIINIDAGVEGNVKFSGPINLRLNGKFEGELEMQGQLSIGENADVKAKIIKGEDIHILGKVKGDIICTKRLEISPSGSVTGNIKTPLLIIKEGATLEGNCQVPAEEGKNEVRKSSKKK